MTNSFQFFVGYHFFSFEVEFEFLFQSKVLIFELLLPFIAQVFFGNLLVILLILIDKQNTTKLLNGLGNSCRTRSGSRVTICAGSVPTQSVSIEWWLDKSSKDPKGDRKTGSNPCRLSLQSSSAFLPTFSRSDVHHPNLRVGSFTTVVHRSFILLLKIFFKRQSNTRKSEKLKIIWVKTFGKISKYS